jgi:hypothetical protein
MSKADLIETLCNLIGEPTARVIDPRDGWPGIIEVQLSRGPERFSAHVGQIHSHARKHYEYRFQNPAKEPRPPVTAFPGTQALLIGVWDGDGPPVLVAAEPEIRFGDTTRFSVLFPERLFREAQQFGWSEPYRNNKGNLHWSFLPSLLPTFIELYQAQAPVDPKQLQIAIVGAGLTEEADAASAARARRATTRLVRAAEFGRDVVVAYGARCAMCDLNLGLVVGAHILPVSAAHSVDRVWNGIALCENHHRAFDGHRIWVHPEGRQVKIHPNILRHAQANPRSQLFVDSTFGVLASPLQVADHPKTEMFNERYEYYEDEYDWA